MIAPWRDWSFKSRTDLINFAQLHQIPVPKDKHGEAPFSVDANLLHSSSEGKVLEDPNETPPPYVYMRTIAPEEAPDTPTVIDARCRMRVRSRRATNACQFAVASVWMNSSSASRMESS